MRWGLGTPAGVELNYKFKYVQLNIFFKNSLILIKNKETLKPSGETDRLQDQWTGQRTSLNPQHATVLCKSMHLTILIVWGNADKAHSFPINGETRVTVNEDKQTYRHLHYGRQVSMVKETTFQDEAASVWFHETVSVVTSSVTLHGSWGRISKRLWEHWVKNRQFLLMSWNLFFFWL